MVRSGTRDLTDAASSSVPAARRNGDRCAFERLRGSTRLYAYSRVGDWEAADDLTQEAFLRVLRKRGASNGASQLPAYLKRTIHNLCIDYRRGHREELSLELLAGGDPFAEFWMPSAEVEAMRRERERRIEAAIADLPLLYQEVFVLRHLHGRKPREIAPALGAQLKAVKKRLEKARQLFVSNLRAVARRNGRLPLSCDQCRDLFAPFISGQLTFPEVRRTHQHLDDCRGCTQALDEACAAATTLDGLVEAGRCTPRAWTRACESVLANADELVHDSRRLSSVVWSVLPYEWDSRRSAAAEAVLSVVRGAAEACVEANPTVPSAYRALARVRSLQGDPFGAAAVLERGCKAATGLPSSSNTRAEGAWCATSLSWCLLDACAWAATAEGALREARRHRVRAVHWAQEARRWGLHPDWFAVLPVALAYLGRTEAALDQLERDRRWLARYGETPTWLAECNTYEKAGHYRQALAHYQQRVASLPLDGRDLNVLSVPYAALDLPDEAGFWARRATAMRKG